MAKLYRNATTRDYYTKTRIKGEFVTLQIDNDGKNFLLQNGVVTGRVIPPEMMSTLWDKGWLYTRGEYPHIFSAKPGAPVQQPLAFESSSVDNARESRSVSRKVPPSQLRLEPRSRSESENVGRLRAEADPTVGGTGQPEHTFSATSADKANANPMTHPEDAAFVGSMWFWVLVVAAVAIIAWGLFEVL